MKNRSVSALLFAEEVDMGGLKVRQPFPTNRFDQIDPFLLMHHADIAIPADDLPGLSGVGPHPHRGFSPVTFIFKGGVHHRDSRGNDHVVYEGGVQWMNAGMGIIHSERPPADIQERGGRQEIIQLWVNTPARHKMDQPAYYPLSAGEINTSHSPDGLVALHVVAGSINGIPGKIYTLSPVNAATLEFKARGTMELQVPENHNAVLYLLNGQLNIDGYGLVEALNAVVFNQDGEGMTIGATADARALLITGLPLHEKVESYGPFVMNTQTEIMQALRDYQMGKMGILIEE